MLRNFLAFMALIMFFVVGCAREDVSYDGPSLEELIEEEHGDDWWIAGEEDEHDGDGGGMPHLTLPFPSGKWWVVTQSYDTGTHQNWGFEFGDDTYALDFTRSGCEAYGEEVTPIADGTVYRVTYDGYGDQGYGNSVIIDHGDGYYSRYAHLSEVMVNLHESVDTYDYLGRVGNTGYSVGTACSEHPGTHLHLVFYRDTGGYPESVKPEPMSGHIGYSYNCWYNREGNESCWGDPGEYESNDYYDDEGNLDITHFELNPSWGTAGETEFIWTTVVNSPDYEPEATLKIHNSNDNHTYDFSMECVSSESPWVFIYRKSLRDPISYNYWVQVSNGDGNDRSRTSTVRVQNSTRHEPYIYHYDWSPDRGNAGSTVFQWEVGMTSNGSPDILLNILNPSDGRVYDFHMDRRGSSYWWSAEYEKTLRDDTIYPFWISVNNGYTTTTTDVGTVDVR